MRLGSTVNAPGPCSVSRRTGRPPPGATSKRPATAVSVYGSASGSLTGALCARTCIDGRSVRRTVGGPCEQPIGEVHRVLSVRHDQALLDDRATGLVAPHRQPFLEAQLGEMASRQQLGRDPGAVLAGQHGRRPIGESQPLPQRAEHDRAAPGRGQRRHEQAVIAPREHAADGTGGVSSEPVGDEPLVGQQAHDVRAVGRRVGDAAQQLGHDRLPDRPASSTADSADSRQPASVSGPSTPGPP